MCLCIILVQWYRQTVCIVRKIRQQRSNKVRQEAKGASNIHTWGTKITNFSVTILPVFGGKCDSENLVGSTHKQPWRPPAANMCPLLLIES